MCEVGWLIEFVRREFKDVKTDFKYDVYKYIALGAGGAMLALIYALYQKLRHISVDWFVFAGLFVFSFLIFSLAISASRRRTRDAGELGLQLPAAPNPVKTDAKHALKMTDEDPRIYLVGIRVEEHATGVQTFFAFQNRGRTVAHDVHPIPVNIGYRTIYIGFIDNLAVNEIKEVRPYIDREGKKHDIISVLQQECEAKARAEGTMLDRTFQFSLETKYRTFARDRNFATHVTIQYLVWKRLLPGVKLDELFQFQHVDFKRLS